MNHHVYVAEAKHRRCILQLFNNEDVARETEFVSSCPDRFNWIERLGDIELDPSLIANGRLKNHIDGSAKEALRTLVKTCSKDLIRVNEYPSEFVVREHVEDYLRDLRQYYREVCHHPQLPISATPFIDCDESFLKDAVDLEIKRAFLAHVNTLFYPNCGFHNYALQEVEELKPSELEEILAEIRRRGPGMAFSQRLQKEVLIMFRTEEWETKEVFGRGAYTHFQIRVDFFTVGTSARVLRATILLPKYEYLNTGALVQHKRTKEQEGKFDLFKLDEVEIEG